MDRLAAGLAEVYPSTNKGWRIRLEPALDIYVGWVRQPLLIIQGAVALVLLIAGANATSLLLARTLARKKEMAIRAALGAGRWRIARQFLGESILLSVIGGLLGVALAYLGLKLFIAISPVSFPRAGEIALDTGALGFTILLALSTGLLFGVVPAWRSSRPDVMEAMKANTSGTTAGTRHQTFRSTLVVLQMALAVVLQVGAGLMVTHFSGSSTLPRAAIRTMFLRSRCGCPAARS